MERLLLLKKALVLRKKFGLEDVQAVKLGKQVRGDIGHRSYGVVGVRLLPFAEVTVSTGEV